MSWANRVRHPSATPLLHQVQAAAHNLAEQAGIAPGKATACVSDGRRCGAAGHRPRQRGVAAVHLYKALVPNFTVSLKSVD